MKQIVIVISILLLSACQVVPKHLDHAGQDLNGVFKRVVVATTEEIQLSGIEHAAIQWWQDAVISPITELNEKVVFQKGDLIEFKCQPFTELNGRYQLNGLGQLELPYIGSILIEGLDSSEASEALSAQLRARGWLKNDHFHVQVSAVEHASVQVNIDGAVFNRGQTTLNAQPTQLQSPTIRQDSGVFDYGRDLLHALRSAGGVRPDADVSNVLVRRGDKVFSVNLAATVIGGALPQIPTLLNGDQIFVPSVGHEQRGLIRPTSITPPGMRVFMSNLTAPALSNAQSAVGNDSSRLPYGASLIDAAVSANCVGGTHMANASRSVVLITHNYGSARQIVVNRTINELLKNTSNSMVNPYVMPNDAIACYDSKFTNFRDVARGLGELINPFILGRLL